MDKLIRFKENAKLLNKSLHITPLLYGSLGLSLLIKEKIEVDDIDILIPCIYLKEKWEELYKVLTDNGYVLIDLHEHTFLKDNIKYSYASIESLKEFANIDINETTDNNSYLHLNLRQYLKVYEASLKDSYRQINKNKNDQDKINIINNNLKSF